jgi:hypothetical protein
MGFANLIFDLIFRCITLPFLFIFWIVKKITRKKTVSLFFILTIASLLFSLEGFAKYKIGMPYQEAAAVYQDDAIFGKSALYKSSQFYNEECSIFAWFDNDISEYSPTIPKINKIILQSKVKFKKTDPYLIYFFSLAKKHFTKIHGKPDISTEDIHTWFLEEDKILKLEFKKETEGPYTEYQVVVSLK